MLNASLFEASMTGTLCGHDHARQVISGSDDFLYFAQYLSREQSDALFQLLLRNAPWRQEQFSLYGKTLPVPRLTAWYGDPGAAYTYSKIRNEPLPWTDELLELLAGLEDFTGIHFNSVLLNRYRDGSDSVSWHADDEAELGVSPVIASMSLGAARTFHLRDRARKVQSSIVLEHGSLLLMAGRSQADYQHAILKERRPIGERINLTFRVIGVRGSSS